MQSNAPTPLQPVPHARQVAWQNMEYYGFIHFGPNTFTDLEWGHGSEDPKIFNPTSLDCRQWARVAKQAGMKGLILTAKHHDGFCLWPSKYSTHTIAQSSYKNGKGDIIRELSDALKAEGLKLGIYLSPWDRNHPKYGTPEYNQTFANMLKEVLGNYGPIFEVWFDGANGEGPNGKKQVYDWPLFHKTVRELQPNAVMFSDAGPDIRWVGNESGVSDPTCWSTINRDRYVPGTPYYQELTQGQRDGTHWVAAECDVSIRPGWFYHKEQDGQVKTPQQLMDLYNQNVGQNGSFLLNVPPDRRGLINEHDVAALMGFKKLREETFKKDLAKGAKVTADATFNGLDANSLTSGKKSAIWAAPEGVKQATLTIDLGKTKRFDRILLQEKIELGQRVAAFTVDAETDNGWKEIAKGTTIGHKRLLQVPITDAKALRIHITDSRACPVLAAVSVYASPKASVVVESKEARDKRMAWWREARFGMFIHWGLYSVAAGEWNGKPIGGAAEWIQTGAQIKPEDYEPLKAKFNPVKFDAKQWVKIAKDAGMKYIVITSKHHEGFGLWPSKQNDWNVAYTPFKRDILKELAQACKEQGVKLCFYHSIMDWHHPDYLPRRSWDTRDASKANFDKYVAFMKAQLKELLTGYGPIGLVWFDGEWEGTWTHERGKDLDTFVRKLQPNIIINNRVDTGRDGMAGLNNGEGFAGDYGTPEQEIPANGLTTDWESCMTMNDTWGFGKNDHNWKSSETIVRNLIDCASKGGNYLLNVGPTALGEIPQPSVERLSVVGQWTEANGEAIYSSHASPFPKVLPWGRVTQKPGKLYLHVFKGGRIWLPGLKNKLGEAYYLINPSSKLSAEQKQDGVYLDVPTYLPDKLATVIVLPITGTPDIAPILPRPDANGVLNLTASDATITGSAAKFEANKNCIGFWTRAEDNASWEFELPTPGEYKLQLEIACTNEDAGSDYEVQIGTQTVRGTVPATGGWESFKTVDLGNVAIVTAGKSKCIVRAIKLKGGGLMNLRSVRLTAN